MLRLPLPQQGGSLDALRDLLNVESHADWRLLVGWLLAAFRPTGPYPVLILTGEQGAAKSTNGPLAAHADRPERRRAASPSRGTAATW